MRFVWAVVAFVLATVLIGAGIAQDTVFKGPSAEKMELNVSEPAPFVLIDAEVLASREGLQTMIVTGKGDIFVAYGRTADMEAWLSDAEYTHVTLTSEGEVESAAVDAAQEPADGGETAGRNPSGSDLWLDSFSEQDKLVTELQLTEGLSVLIARDGVEAAPDDILISWPLDNSTPMAGPLMAAGGVLLVVGLVLYILAIRHQRRGRGPRRKGVGPLPETQPIGVAESAAAAAIDGGVQAPSGSSQGNDAAPDGNRAQRRSSARRRLAIGLPALAMTAVLATGCTADSWPELGAGTPTPTPTPTIVTPEDQKPPVVTEKQGQRIVSEIAATVAQADTDLDIDLAETRLTGPALESRRTEYVLRDKIAEREGTLTAPRDKVRILLPEATDSWPRTVLVLTASEEDETVPPVLLTMTQADPWAPYKVAEMADMPASSEFPDVAPAWLGATRVPTESPFLSLPPAELADAFADYVDTGDKSEYAGRFDEMSQTLAQTVRDSRAAVVQGLKDKDAAETSKAAFDMTGSTAEPLSMATLDSGAVVAVSVLDTERITPTNKDAVIRIGDNEEAKVLTGAKESAKGFETTYAIQLFFAVPAQGSNEQIRLLAYDQDLLSVKVIK
ncbi:glycosyl transferase [Microbacterium esteraromaticum]|uniref:glycosyl transferase n=1 Tax=Microbacterium esteraromaticum TaxID=57043 RepID=UPI001C93CBFE|nr:glycosyl transferase [Microbacterium esteraromaticum]MBY6061351.1 glycosyl transferase [Microbacterium esteraromaticum]